MYRYICYTLSAWKHGIEPVKQAYRAYLKLKPIDHQKVKLVSPQSLCIKPAFYVALAIPSRPEKVGSMGRTEYLPT